VTFAIVHSFGFGWIDPAVAIKSIDHVHDLELKQFKIMNVIGLIVQSGIAQINLRNPRKLDRAGKPMSAFPHPALDDAAA
jgi:hypothetical protein